MSKHLPNWFIWGFVIVSFIGFIDASYLTISHYTGSSLNCSLLQGCDIVTTSKYSQIFGIPVALMGMFYYFSVLIASLIYVDTKNSKVFKFIQPLTVLGLLGSLYFVYLQLFVIHAICQYCMLSALTSTTLFILGLFYYKFTPLEHETD